MLIRNFFNKFLFLLTSSIILMHNLQAEEFPGREKYPELPYITTEELYQVYNDVLIVDARSQLEYETIHIIKASRHSANDEDFVSAIRQLREQNPEKQIVFYCNGHTCMKSYKATSKAMKAGIKNVVVYDSGIFEWAEAHPDLAVLVGKTPVDVAHMREQKKRFNQHVIPVDEFVNQVHESDSIVLDVRSNKERYESGPIFLLKDKSLTLSNIKQMKRKLTRMKEKNKNFLIYDSSGRTVVWLEYYLTDLGIKNYKFMQGGSFEFSRKAIKKYIFQDDPNKAGSIDQIFTQKQES